jgi:hypothetical protein
MDKELKEEIESIKKEITEIRDYVKSTHKLARETKVRMYEYIDDSKR